MAKFYGYEYEIGTGTAGTWGSLSTAAVPERPLIFIGM